jgi:thiosulfate dehydrogenase
MRRRASVVFAAAAIGGVMCLAGVEACRFDIRPKAPVAKVFSPPPVSAIPDNEFGREVALGRAIFNDPDHQAPEFVGNTLRCSNCHLGEGRVANASPMWGAYVSYPQYRAKNGHVNTFAERLQGCFKFSMNGKAPPLGDKTLVALETYAYFLAKGAPVGVRMPGAGYPKLPPPALKASYSRGQDVYSNNCALCHGFDGKGQSSNGQPVFPPIWGPNSYNWGAGMADVSNAAGFIQANMPLGKGGTLSAQQAWDVATFIDSQPRPQDPRFTGDVAQTRAKFHDTPGSMYGMTVNGVLLGQGPRTDKAALSKASPDLD